MTYDFAVREANRRQAVLGKDYAVVYSEAGMSVEPYMVITLDRAMAADMLIVDKITSQGGEF